MDGAVETVEAALARPVVGGGSGSYMGGDVPLARHVGGVACCLHDLCDGTDVLAEVTPIAGEFLVSHHPSDARLVGISACKESCSCGAAPSCVIELRESYPVIGQSV